MRRAVSTVSAIALLIITSCGGGGGGANADQFTSDLDDICRPLKKDLDALAVPVSLAEVGTTANQASRLIEDAVAEMRKLSIPTSNKTFQNDANDLLDTFGSQVDVLDDIASAAAGGDDQEAADKVDRFITLSDQANEIADDMDVNRCKLDPIFGDDVQPDDTIPLDTLPVDTVPLDTVPLDTVPVDTVAPGADNKVEEDLASQLVPAGDYTFVNTDPDLFQTFRNLLAVSPIISAQPGTIGAVDLISGGISFAHVFAFAPDALLAPDSAVQFAELVAAGQPTTPANFGGVEGLRWTTTDGIEMFVGSLSDVVMLWSVATNLPDLEAGVVDLIDSIA